MGICAWCWYWDKYQLMATWTVALSSCCWWKRVSGQKQIRKKQQYMQTTRTNCILESVNARANYSISQNRVPQLSSRVLPNISSTLPAGKVGILWSSTEHWRTMCGQWKGKSIWLYPIINDRIVHGLLYCTGYGVWVQLTTGKLVQKIQWPTDTNMGSKHCALPKVRPLNTKSVSSPRLRKFSINLPPHILAYCVVFVSGHTSKLKKVAFAAW